MAKNDKQASAPDANSSSQQSDTQPGAATASEKDANSIDPTSKTPQPPTLASEIEQKIDDVLMVFPRAVRLMLDSGVVVQFEKGVQRVAKDLADHWYLIAHGVKRA